MAWLLIKKVDSFVLGITNS